LRNAPGGKGLIAELSLPRRQSSAVRQRGSLGA